MRKINTVYDLKRAYIEHNPFDHYFDRKTLKFWGETMKTMRFSRVPVTITDVRGYKREVYRLRTYQKRHPLGPRWTTMYFDIYTFQQVFKEDDDQWE